MDVRDIFALRKQPGKTLEAYQAISALYAVHHGPHTSTCMFWCTNDLLRQRLQEKNVPEARRLLWQLIHIDIPKWDEGGRMNRAICRAAFELDKLVPDFNIFFFSLYFGALENEDWLPQKINGKRYPSFGQRVVNRLMRDIADRTPGEIRVATDLFREALRRQPFDKENLRNLAKMYIALDQKEKAIPIYKNLLRRYSDSYLHREMAAIVNDPTDKTALLCRAIVNQPREDWRAKDHLELAKALISLDRLSHAAYELSQCVAIYQRRGRALTPEIESLQQRLAGVQPVTEQKELFLYDRAKTYVEHLTDSLISKKVRDWKQGRERW